MKISYSYLIRCQGSRNSQNLMSVTVWRFFIFHIHTVCHIYNIAGRYRKLILIFEMCFIDNIDFLFLASSTRISSNPIQQLSIQQICREERAIKVRLWSDLWIKLSEQLWNITCNKHCYDAHIQIKWVIFHIIMHRYSITIPYFAWSFGGSAVFKIPTLRHNIPYRTCAPASRV